MESLDKVINEARDAREVKRALCVKMRLSEMAISQICELLELLRLYNQQLSCFSLRSDCQAKLRKNKQNRKFHLFSYHSRVASKG